VSAAFKETDEALEEQELRLEREQKEAEAARRPHRASDESGKRAPGIKRGLPTSPFKAREAGTTATVALLTREGTLVVGNVGDSRALVCCQSDPGQSGGGGGGKGGGVPLVLTRDHTAGDPAEAARVRALGVTVVEGPNSKVARVNGQIAVTRSLGDRPHKPFLTPEPHVHILHLPASRGRDGGNGGGEGGYEFLVVATDGLWDVVSSEEVVAYVRARRAAGLGWQEVATALTHEALLRSSLDNIGVYVVDLVHRDYGAFALPEGDL